MSEFKAGDEAWFARSTPRKVTLMCPVCAGNRSVTVLLGSGAPVITRCEYCSLGFEGPRGYVVEYDHDPKAERVKVTEVHAEERTGHERRVTYLVDGNCLAYPDDLFTDEALALAAAQAKAAAAQDAEDENRRRSKRSKVDRQTWNVGYHMREAEKHRKEAERHEERAATLKARAKAVTP
jgi:hypothetical protein